MKKCASSISIIVILMIVLSSIIQFHHHDNKGNIVFSVSSICSNKNHKHSDIYGILAKCCHCTHHENGHKCGNNENCSAHLGDYQATKQTYLSINDIPTLLISAIIDNSHIYLPIFDSQSFKFHNTIIPIYKGIINHVGLRAPPQS